MERLKNYAIRIYFLRRCPEEKQTDEKMEKYMKIQEKNTPKGPKPEKFKVVKTTPPCS